MKNKYAPFFAAYNRSKMAGNPHTKEEVIRSFTNDRTTSLKDLDHWELQELTRRLSAMTPATVKDPKADKMRKAIIAIFRSMDRSVEDAKKWAEKQGVKGTKKEFNEYTTGELHVLIGIAEKIKSDWMHGIRNRISKINE
jgi:hypothetical protein